MPLGDVTAEMRSQVKQFSYGIAYGMSAYGVSQRLGVEMDEAASFVETYYAQFPKLREFLSAQVEKAKIDGFTTTMLGAGAIYQSFVRQIIVCALSASAWPLTLPFKVAQPILSKRP